ncbi:SAF domain-containing protein [Microbacterium sp. 179-I 3D2 NHS]|uniref:SAF domain-containing protein n=1 Tax=Microbacterium sp. 179-I 3D2 NHS TaxID=3235178 RepID=UPI0039A366C2
MAVLSRPQRAFWGDVRFLVGIVLVALSVGGVWLLVAASDATTPVLQAKRTITPGEILEAGDFQVIEVGLGPVTGDYLAPQDLEPGRIASRTLQKGELVPSGVLADAAESRRTTVVVESSTSLPEDVVAGTVVEVWHAPPLDDGRSFDEPRILVAEVIVRAVVEADGMLAAEETQVELVIDRADVAEVLSAITGGSTLSVVPVRSGS